MQTHCPNCGAELFPGARFCRRCGAPVREPGVEDASGVSPMAATVPLREEGKGRETDGLAPGEERTSASTSRVSREDLERLLRAQKEADQSQKRLDPEATAAQFGRDTLADARARGDGETRDDRMRGDGAARDDSTAQDPAATLVASSAVTRPEVPVAFGPGEDLTIPVPRPAPPTESFKTPADSAPLQHTPSSPLQHMTRDAPAYVTGDVAAGESTLPSSPSPTSPDGYAPAPTQDAQTSAAAQGVQASQGAQASTETQGGQVSTATQDVQTSVATQGVAASVAARRRRWPLVVAACAALLIFTAAAALLAYRLLRRPQVAQLPTQGPAATPLAPDAQQQFDEKLAQAEALLAQGNMDEAVARLREANELDPANVRAHRRLGELLLASGARREAVEEFRAVTRNAPEDFAAWRQLATAQFAEGLYRDAAESYRRLVALVGDAADPADLLSYADALRLSGRAEEARTIYQRLAAAQPTEVADAARQRLAELAREQPTPGQRTGEPQSQPAREGEAASSATPAEQTTPTPQPTSTPPPTPTPQPARPSASTPAEHYRRGVELWSSNRGAALAEFQAAASAGNADAHYYLGLGYVEGKNLHTLKRAEVVAALQHFQAAQHGGEHAGDARRYAQELEKEFDRLRNQR